MSPAARRTEASSVAASPVEAEPITQGYTIVYFGVPPAGRELCGGLAASEVAGRGRAAAVAVAVDVAVDGLEVGVGDGRLGDGRKVAALGEADQVTEEAGQTHVGGGDDADPVNVTDTVGFGSGENPPCQ